jgi:Nup93/Nic96
MVQLFGMFCTTVSCNDLVGAVLYFSLLSAYLIIELVIVSGLRCGDAHAAVEVLSATPAGIADFAAEQPVLHRIFDKLSRFQASNICIFQSGIPFVDDQERAAVLNFYERAKNMEPNNTHKINVLALLCGQQLESVATIEDYLFGRFWLAVQDRENSVALVKEVGESIRKWGPSYFAANDAGAWGYCLPLLCAQQFRTALSFLAEAGGAMGMVEAVHLGLIFTMAGVEVSDLDESDPVGPPCRDVATVLLTKYAQMLEMTPSVGIVAPLQYLLQIPKKSDLDDQIAGMLLRSSNENITILVGTPDSLNSRQQAELDKYLPSHEVDSILEAAADIIKRQAADKNKAFLSAKLYMLANCHVKTIEFLIQLVSPPDSLDNDKPYWDMEAHNFCDAFLTNHSVVLASLERSKRMDLPQALKAMLQLRRFFDLRRQGKFEEAFSIVAATDLLPLRQEQVDAKKSGFKDLHSAVKAAMPSTVSAAVECLYERYRRLQSESRGVSVELEAHLGEIKTYARIIFVFASLTNMPRTCINDISQMRANMV